MIVSSPSGIENVVKLRGSDFSIIIIALIFAILVGFVEAARPVNGTFIKPAELNGYGELSIVNSLQEDSVAILTDLDNNTIFSVYIWGNKNFVNISGIEDGLYFMYFATGRDWDPELGEFLTDVGFSMMKDKLGFKTMRTSGGSSTSIVIVEIYSVSEAEQNRVAKDIFPQIM
ncbi:MAG: hypothetical protein MUO26_10385 [Methanotrichaceae archaeon]|nr:hypothetical protein [Methanotrichaceae archaeon]